MIQLVLPCFHHILLRNSELPLTSQFSPLVPLPRPRLSTRHFRCLGIFKLMLVSTLRHALAWPANPGFIHWCFAAHRRHFFVLPSSFSLPLFRSSSALQVVFIYTSRALVHTLWCLHKWILMFYDAAARAYTGHSARLNGIKFLMQHTQCMCSKNERQQNVPNTAYSNLLEWFKMFTHRHGRCQSSRTTSASWDFSAACLDSGVRD